MKLSIKLFAGLADFFEQRELALEVQNGATVRQVRMQLEQQFPSASSLLAQSLFAINQRYAADDDVFGEDVWEVALIPPVGGGAPVARHCLVTEEPLSVDAAFGELEDEHCGGTVLFCGTIREWTKGRQTEKLSYEAYVEMAVRQMQIIHDEVCRAHPGVNILQWHRIGELRPKDTAVICAASAAHRDVAFEVARLLIERVKAEVPIWKKEYYADGTTVWQQNETEPS